MYIGEIAALLTAFCWVGSSVSFEFSGKQVGSLVLNLMRLVISLVVITVINFFITSGFQNLTVSPEAFQALLISGFVGLVIGDLFLFQAFVEIGARISMLIMALAPPITAVLSYFLLDETLGFFQILGMAVTILGIAVVILGKDKRAQKIVVKHPLKGILFAFLGAVGQALGLILSKVGVAELNPFVASEIRIFSGILGFMVILAFTRKWPSFFKAFKNKTAMVGITVGSLFGPVVGVSLSLMAVKYTSTAIASTLMAIVPILIIPVSIFIFKEKVKANEIIGALIGVFGVAIIFIG